MYHIAQQSYPVYSREVKTYEQTKVYCIDSSSTVLILSKMGNNPNDIHG